MTAPLIRNSHTLYGKINVNIRIAQIVESGCFWRMKNEEGWEMVLLLYY